jgi:hypothetical protein
VKTADEGAILCTPFSSMETKSRLIQIKNFSLFFARIWGWWEPKMVAAKVPAGLAR